MGASRQQLFQLVLDAPLIPSPPACSQRPAAESHRSPASQPDSKEVLGIDSFLRKDKVCTSTKAGGLAWTDQKSFKTEEHHDLYSTSAEVGGKDSKVGSQEIPGCTKSHEKPSTSVVKADKKGEVFDSWLCPALSPMCDCLYALEDPQYVALTPFLHVVLIRVGTFSSFPFNWPVLPSHCCWCGTALLQACSSRGSLSCCQGIKWNPALTDSFALSNSTKKQ